MYVSISDAIFSLGGSSSDFTRIVGDTYEGIDWTDEVKFTEEEIEEALAQLREEAELNEYQELRAKGYPDFREYLDGVVKGDQDQIDAYIQQCLAVKAKYPKPVQDVG